MKLTARFEMPQRVISQHHKNGATADRNHAALVGTQLLPWVPVESGTYRVNKVKNEAEIEAACMIVDVTFETTIYQVPPGRFEFCAI